MTEPIRGVYRLEYLSAEGFPVYVAISRDRRRLAERTIYPFESKARVKAALQAELDELDPVSWAV